MNRLHCKHRETAPVVRNQNIYFCCHPEDFDSCFTEISTDLLSQLPNCSIWYREDSLWDEELENDLALMQLFVMPVTKTLLTTANRAIDDEFRFAAEHRIPVLPLMQEKHLEDRFNAKCGNLQALNKYHKDNTALSFDDKLHRYLSRIFPDDDTLDQISREFDARIFLSYRKKDRKAAQELMQMIHEQPICRDVAIWYDEFLNPGEDFNHAIRDALQQCDLFALTVTPNLVNETNYVMTQEYPSAVDASKDILPVEMRTTDHSQLRELYHGIPDSLNCTNRYHTEPLSAALAERFGSRISPHDTRSPIHDYLIGLAYLNGIDMEVNRSRGLALITRAAQAGQPQAIAQLSMMYRTGTGVERDYEASIYWHKILLHLMNLTYAETHDTQLLYNAMEETRDLTLLMFELLDMKEAGDLALDMKEQLEQTGLLDTDVRIQEYYYFACINLSVARKSEYNQSEYIHLIDLCIATCRKMVQLTDHLQPKIHLAHSLLSAAFSLQHNNPEEARRQFTEALDLSRSLFDQYHTSDAGWELVRCCLGLATLSCDTGDWTAAESCCKEVLTLASSLGDSERWSENQSMIWHAYLKLADIEEQLSRPLQARKYLEQGLPHAKQLVDEQDSGAARLLLIDFYRRLGSLTQSEGNVKRALEHYQNAVKLSEKILSDTDSPEHRHSLASILLEEGQVLLDSEALDAAQNVCERALNLVLQSSELQDIPSHRDLLSDCYTALGSLFLRQGQNDRARSFYLKSLDLCLSLAAELKDNYDQWSIAVLYGNLSTICENENDPVQALSYLEKGVELTWQLVHDSNTEELCIQAQFYARLSKLLCGMNRLEEATHYSSLALAQMGHVCTLAPSQYHYMNLSESCLSALCTAVENGDSSLALKHAEHNLSTVKKWISLSETPNARRALAHAYYCMSLCEQEPVQMKKYAGKSLSLYKALFRDDPTFLSNRDLCEALAHMGKTLSACNDFTQAESYLTQALKKSEKLYRETQSSDEYRLFAQVSLDLAQVIARSNPKRAHSCYETVIHLWKKHADDMNPQDVFDLLANAVDGLCWKDGDPVLHREYIPFLLTLRDAIERTDPDPEDSFAHLWLVRVYHALLGIYDLQGMSRESADVSDKILYLLPFAGIDLDE